MLIVFVIWLGVFPPSHRRIPTNHMRAVHSMNQIGAAEKAFAARNPALGFTCDLADLFNVLPETQGGVGAIDRVLSKGEKAGYRFAISDCRQNRSNRTVGYKLAALPLNRDVGTFAFCSDEIGVLFYSETGSLEGCFEHRTTWTKGDVLDRQR